MTGKKYADQYDHTHFLQEILQGIEELEGMGRLQRAP